MTPRRVLVVDDEDDIREVAQLSLELVGGWSVLLASSGSEAVALAADRQPDAVLLDVMMPGMDGPQVFEALQANPDTRHIPVIFLTAKAQTSEQRQLRDLGVRGLIAKPFDPVALPQCIADLLGDPE